MPPCLRCPAKPAPNTTAKKKPENYCFRDFLIILPPVPRVPNTFNLLFMNFPYLAKALLPLPLLLKIPLHKAIVESVN